jgi:hypothetical protein
MQLRMGQAAFSTISLRLEAAAEAAKMMRPVVPAVLAAAAEQIPAEVRVVEVAPQA